MDCTWDHSYDKKIIVDVGKRAKVFNDDFCIRGLCTMLHWIEIRATRKMTGGTSEVRSDKKNHQVLTLFEHQP